MLLFLLPLDMGFLSLKALVFLVFVFIIQTANSVSLRKMIQLLREDYFNVNIFQFHVKRLGTVQRHSAVKNVQKIQRK